MTNFKAWTPPPCVAVVPPPVHPETVVSVIFSNGEFSGEGPAGDLNWSAVGDGCEIVAYAVVLEYKPAPVLREWWITMHQGFAWDSEEQAKRNSYDGAIHHVREVPDPSREVVAWAVVENGLAVQSFIACEAAADAWAREYGGTVVKLTGVMP